MYILQIYSVLRNIPWNFTSPFSYNFFTCSMYQMNLEWVFFLSKEKSQDLPFPWHASRWTWIRDQGSGKGVQWNYVNFWNKCDRKLGVQFPLLPILNYYSLLDTWFLISELFATCWGLGLKYPTNSKILIWMSCKTLSWLLIQSNHIIVIPQVKYGQNC